MDDLSSPAVVMQRLEEIERDLANRQNEFESAARGWYAARAEIERRKAVALLSAQDGSVTEKKARAELAAFDVALLGFESEYEALKAVVRVLEARATINQSLLRAQGRV